MSEDLYKGENLLIETTFSDVFGNAIEYSNITALEVTFKQGDSTVTTYTKSDPEIREGDVSTEVEIELKASVSNTLTIGRPLSIRYKVTVSNSDFDVDTSQVNIFERTIAETVK